jgi:hypothetical protein
MDRHVSQLEKTTGGAQPRALTGTDCKRGLFVLMYTIQPYQVQIRDVWSY